MEARRIKERLHQTILCKLLDINEEIYAFPLNVLYLFRIECLSYFIQIHIIICVELVNLVEGLSSFVYVCRTRSVEWRTSSWHDQDFKSEG